MKVPFCLLFALQGVWAFPSVLQRALEPELEPELEPRVAGCTTSALCEKKIVIPDSKLRINAAGVAASKGRNNGGNLTPITFFDAKEQYVSTTGAHQYADPKPGQIRGPCPGLNSAANHGYLARSGVQTLLGTITGLGQAFAMSADLAGFLGAYAIAIDGDVLTGTWSIGGPPPSLGVGGKPQGISFSHNKYEGDTSMSRCDAYINNGDAHSLSIQKFRDIYSEGLDNRIFTFDKFARGFTKNTFRSIQTNPLYFAPLFSTTLVSPAAYNFVVAMMSNHTADKPDGQLTGRVFKQFFGISGTYPNFKWLPGKERIPDNWYRRPTLEPYTAHTGVFGDLASEFVAYPDSFRFGGNSKGVNSYTGISLSDFTGGVFNGSNLFTPDALACFAYQEIQQGLPDALTGGINALGPAQALLNPQLTKAFGGIPNCPKITKFNNNNLGNYPGHKYNPKGAATTC